MTPQMPGRHPKAPADRDRGTRRTRASARSTAVPHTPPANGRRRTRALFVTVLFVFSLFTAQLLRLQGFEADALAQKGRAMRLSNATIPAVRGQILDRQGLELATSVDRKKVVASPRDVKQYRRYDKKAKTRVGRTVGADGAAADLAPLVGRSAADLLPLLTKQKGGKDKLYEVIAKDIEPQTWRKIRELRIPGISSEATSRRTYPAGASTAALLGWVGANGKARGDKRMNNIGQEFRDGGSGWGLEIQYDDLLTGTPGGARREISGDGRTIPMGDNALIPAIPGRNLTLTVDRDLSWFAYNAVAAQVRKYKAESGYVVVMDRQGRILAMAQYPTFDPVDPGKKGSQLRNLSLEDIFEPGSTAKVMSIGAALAEGVVNPASQFLVPYSIKRGGRVLHDSHEHETEHLTTAGILAQSSNVGTMLVAEKLGKDKLEAYFRSFGAGARSGLNYPNESVGILAPSADWSSSQRFTVMFGQGVAMTAIQTAGVFQTIANGGVRIPPTLVAGESRPDGSYLANPLPEGKRVLSTPVTAQLTSMMEAVVGEGGTAQSAMIPGYRVAGKTGTATRYKPGEYTASFIGMAPAEDPQYIVAVTVQSPRGSIFGGVVAGPVFRQVMAYALARGQVKPSTTLPQLYPLKVGEAAPRVAWAEDIAKAEVTPDTAPKPRTPAESPAASPSGSSSPSRSASR